MRSKRNEIQTLKDNYLNGLKQLDYARVAIDAYKWSAGKKKPKKYGDKLDLTSDGEAINTPTYIVNVIETPEIENDDKKPEQA